MNYKMERELEKDSAKIVKKERFQGKMVKYVSGIGKVLLFILPILLLIVTILAFISVLDFTLRIVFFVILGIYAFNSVMLLLGANSTNSSLNPNASKAFSVPPNEINKIFFPSSTSFFIASIVDLNLCLDETFSLLCTQNLIKLPSFNLGNSICFNWLHLKKYSNILQWVNRLLLTKYLRILII